MNTTHKLIILGSGPAGLTAAIYSSRAGLKPLLIGGLTYGGQLMTTTDVENFPGFHKGVQGPELIQNMIAQAERFGTEIVYEDVTKVDFSRKPFQVSVGNKQFQSEAVIVATGAGYKWLEIPSETRLRGHGISACATCDGFFFKGQEVVVVGGGDAAMEEALYLTKFATKVTVLNRSQILRASKIMQDKAKTNPKITVLYNKTVEEFLGQDRLTAIQIKDVATGQVNQMEVGGAFIAIGHKPNTDVFTDQIQLDEKGFIVVTDNTKTSKDGVFVAGDVQDHRYRQAITAAGMGCMAALDAEKYLGMDQG
jgi:thioredoxin reductase (NADPH)